MGFENSTSARLSENCYNYKIDKNLLNPYIKSNLGPTQNIHCMNYCEALDTLKFNWSSLDEASGPRQQQETIS